MNTNNLQTNQHASGLVASLFGVLALMQLIDLHSTLTAVAGRIEQNTFIFWLSTHVGLPVALSLIKAIDLVVVFALYKTWRTTAGRFDAQFVVLLCLMNLVYAVVATGNYAG